MTRLLSLVVACALGACGSSAGPASDAGTSDAGSKTDAACSDASTDASSVQSDAGGSLAADAAASDGGETLASRISTRARTYVGAGTVTITLTGPESVPQVPTLVVGVVSPRYLDVLTLARPGEPLPDRRTIFPLSSISKAITGLLAARGVAEGHFSADGPVSALLGADLAPLVGDRTLLELVTHTAGYAADPGNLDRTNPYSPAAGYSRAKLQACLADGKCATGKAVRGQYLYSNLSLGLLGVALADHYQKTYEALVVDRLTKTLGMSDTHTRAFVDESRLAPDGLTPGGVRVPAATMGVLAPAGELLSTADDTLKLLAALIDPPSSLQDAVVLATKPAAGNVGYAIDLVTRDSMQLWSKSGEQAGYSSIIIWCPALHAGVFAFANLGDSSKTLAALAVEILGMVRDFPGG